MKSLDSDNAILIKILKQQVHILCDILYVFQKEVINGGCTGLFGLVNYLSVHFIRHIPFMVILKISLPLKIPKGVHS